MPRGCGLDAFLTWNAKLAYDPFQIGNVSLVILNGGEVGVRNLT
jgi:hypothetical protein